MRRCFHPGFETDLIAAARYLGQQRTGYDRTFLEATEESVETIMATPATWRPWSGDIRRFLLPKFPYTIRYRIRPGEDLVEFLSIVHTARHPQSELNR